MIRFWKRPERVARVNEVEVSLRRLRATQKDIDALNRWAEENHFFGIILSGIESIMEREVSE